MDILLEEHDKAFRKGTFSKSISDLNKTIELLGNIRESIVASPTESPLTLAKAQTPVKAALEDVNHDLRDVHHAIAKYTKALDRKFKDKPLPTAEYDALSMRPDLISRAIGMHFLREGEFSVASTYLSESAIDGDARHRGFLALEQHNSWNQDQTYQILRSDDLRTQFSEMYYILDEMKSRRNLIPAATWAREHSSQLEARGSDLEFDLAKLQFVYLFEKQREGSDFTANTPRHAEAFAYARQTFTRFQGRHLKDIQKLIGAIAFCPNLTQSPYKQLFKNESVWADLASSFSREFCSLLGLSAESPVYIATTAGAIALPTLQKLQIIMATKRTEWTTQNELPVEIALPPTYRFHSIFVCPVSKEQTTDENPPMMMPCGHVIAQESLQRLGKVSKFKCPYCPGESRPSEAKKVFL